jgi:hypothetical protein
MITLDPKFVRIADFTNQNTETIVFGDEGISVNNPLGKGIRLNPGSVE